MNTTANITDIVKRKFGEIAEQVIAGRDVSCCEPSCCGGTNPITEDLYEPGQMRNLPPDAVTAPLGCGNPTALAELRPGETVLDLGSGGGIDVLLSARRVGPTGKTYMVST